MNSNYDIGAIEDALWEAMKLAKVCPVIYANRRPTTTAISAPAFVVLKSVTEIIDKTAYGRNICRAEIYTKELSGVKDSAKMSLYSKKVMAALPIITDQYEFTYLSNIPLGLDGTGYDVDAININVLIKFNNN